MKIVSIAFAFALAILTIASCSGNDSSTASAPIAQDASSALITDAAANPTDAPRPESDAAIAEVDCGKRSDRRGLTNRSLSVGGVTRTYLAYLPAALDATKPLPFVFVFHGYLMSGQQMHDITQYATLADSEGIAVVFPDGQGGPDSLLAPWNVENSGQTVCGAGQLEVAAGDDSAFMDAIEADVAEDQCLDSAHVFATGFSMGGYLSHHLGCYRGDIKGIAPHSGGTIADLSVCSNGPMPVIIFHGTGDTMIAPGCDDPNSPAQAGFSASAALWAKKNGCKSTYATTVETGSGGNGQCYVYDGCPTNGQVELCTFTDMQHCWAGGNNSGQGSTSACPSYASATALEWSFFKKYAW